MKWFLAFSLCWLEPAAGIIGTGKKTLFMFSIQGKPDICGIERRHSSKTKVYLMFLMINGSVYIAQLLCA